MSAGVDRGRIARVNRRLWTAFVVVLALQLWPLRDLANRIEPWVGPLPFTVAWHLAGVAAFVAIYLLWMRLVWTADDDGPAQASREGR